MRHLKPIPFLAAALALAVAQASAQDPTPPPATPPAYYPTLPDLPTVNRWHECPEYLPERNRADKINQSKGCRIEFDMAQTGKPTPPVAGQYQFPPQVHKDVAVWPDRNLRAVVVLRHSSPFVSCTLATTPTPLARDLTPNVGTLLTALGGLGAIAPATSAVLAAGQAAAAENAFEAQSRAGFAPQAEPADPYSRELITDGKAHSEADKIVDELDALHTALLAPQASVASAFADLKIIEDTLAYSYPDDPTAAKDLAATYGAATDFLAIKLPDESNAVDLVARSKALAADLDTFEKDTAAIQDQVKRFRQAAEPAITEEQEEVLGLSARIPFLADISPKIRSMVDLVVSLADHSGDGSGTLTFTTGAYTEKLLPVAIYPEAKVGVTVSCADAATQKQIFDNIQFTLYSQRPPTIDISAGFVVSFLKGRQVGVQTVEVPGQPSATPTYQLAVTSSSRVQFIPGTFFEYHPVNFHLPWAKDPARPYGPFDPKADQKSWMSLGAIRHPGGYVGTFGLAGGVLVNPNNGTGEAELFEGISFGIQRFSILLGNHTGHSQNFAGGYNVGDLVPAGVAPPTARNWGNGLAFGLAYRLPLR